MRTFRRITHYKPSVKYPAINHPKCIQPVVQGKDPWILIGILSTDISLSVRRTKPQDITDTLVVKFIDILYIKHGQTTT